MKMEGLVVNNVEPAAGDEMEPLLRREIPTYLKFRLGREKQSTDKCTNFALTVFKVCFCSVGLWGHHAWNYIPRVFLGLVCIYQVFFVLYFDVLDKCHMNYGNITDAEKLQMKHGAFIEHIDEAILNMASVVSFLVFIGCFTVAKQKESALVSPSLSMMENIDKKVTLMLFVYFVIVTSLLASSVGLIYKTSVEIRLAEGSFCKHLVGMAIAAQFILHWVSLNICHIFAFSSLALGSFVQDVLRLIRNLQGSTGTLDNIIRIHEDLCTVVFSTVSAYSVWFVLHWFTYAAGIPVAIIFLSKGIELIPVLDRVHVSIFIVCLLYLFLLPSVCAARITSHCAGIYEKINHTTSDDWNERHPFKDRHNIALFISYAKERRCGFKIGRITFNASLAWVSLFFGITALLFHFF